MTKREMDAIKTDMEATGFTGLVEIHATLKSGKKIWMVGGTSPVDDKHHILREVDDWNRLKGKLEPARE